MEIVLKSSAIILFALAAGILIPRIIYRVSRKEMEKGARFPWPEKARILYPFLSSLSDAPSLFFALFWIPLLLYGITTKQWIVWPAMAGGLIGINVVHSSLRKRAEAILSRRVMPGRDMMKDVASQTGFCLILGVFLVLQPGEFNWWSAAVAFGAVLILAAWVRLTSPLSSVLRGSPMEVPERLEAIVSGPALNTGMAASRILLLDSDIAGIDVQQRQRRLIYSKALLDLLDDAELDALTRAEICSPGTAVNFPSNWCLFPRLAGLFSMAAPLPVFRAGWAALGTTYGVMAIGVWIFLASMPPALARAVRPASSESRAKELQAVSVDLMAYGRAVEKIHRHECLPAMTDDVRYHPDLVMVLTSFGIVTPWPRPGPVKMTETSNQHLTIVICLAALGAVLAVLLPDWSH
ncbi:MAG TPA: hypothetical protein VG796_29760 [Verrucomicrobiales bacterium]|jgi:hypothetical protein|nr:hypothetical protein [Verrucomicrobiales bacterium]